MASIQHEDPRLAEALARIAELESSLRRIEAAHRTKPDAPAAPAKQKPGVDIMVWNVIAAAVAAVVPEMHRIVGVQMQGPPLNLWSFEGRRAIFYSHQVRRA